VYLFGQALQSFDCSGCKSIDEFKTTLAAFSKAHPNRAWIIGRGWEQDVLGRYPTKEDIDAVVSDRPVFIWRACYHVAAVNSKALALGNMTADTKDPDGGIIDRVSQSDHTPSGTLREVAAHHIWDLVKEDDAVRLEYLRTGLNYCLQMGIVMVQTNDVDCWRLYKKLADDGELPIR
jgi:predicted amidohydrolase YtcJ